MSELTRVRLPQVRLSFPQLFEPKAFNEGQVAKYSAAFLIDPNTDLGANTIADIEAEMKRVAEEKWGVGKIPRSVKYCLHDGNEKDYNGYEDMMYVSAGNTKKPAVLIKKEGINVEADESEILAGYYVNATLSFWAQDNGFGRKINANLRMVQFYRKGDTFGAGAIDGDKEAEGFDDFAGDDDLI